MLTGCSALEEDAAKALAALKTSKFQGRRLTGELAVKKHVKVDPAIMAAERKAGAKPKREPLPKREKRGQRVPTERVEIAFALADGKAALPADFSKKTLYKKVRKVGAVLELVYPHEGSGMRAAAVFETAAEASRAAKKLDKHVFKGVTMSASVLMGFRDAAAVVAAAAPAAAATSQQGVKAHRLIVRNLPFSVTPQVLDEHFKAFGRVLEIVLPTKPGSTQLRGFAFVQFAAREAAVLAMAATNGRELAGRVVAVDWAVGKTLYEQIVRSEAAAEPAAGGDAEIVDVETVSGDEGAEQADEELGVYELGDEDVDVETVEAGDDNDNDDDNDSGNQDHDDPDARTVFVRNIAFETGEAAVAEKFASRFGALDYCKLVVNKETGTSRGSAFVRFQSRASADKAVRASSNLQQDELKVLPAEGGGRPLLRDEDLEALKKKRAGRVFKSVLVDNENTVDSDHGGILLEGRALSVVPAVDRDRAKELRLADAQPDAPSDKRRLRLIDESLLVPMSPAAKRLYSEEDVQARRLVVKARLAHLRKNPNSVISTVRLSIRHLPTAVDEAQLRLVVDAVLAEALPQAARVLADSPAHAENAAKARPRIKQVKVVRATGEERESRAGRSKGFAFVELTQPAHAMLLLRFLTNWGPDAWHRTLPAVFGRRHKHAADGPAKAAQGATLAAGKPLVPIVEFAIDKTAVMDRQGAGPAGKRQQHKRAPPAPPAAPRKRPGFNKKGPQPKRARK